MQITIFGLIWLIISFIFIVLEKKYIFFLLICSCIFQASAVFLIEKKGISPLLISELFFIAKCANLFQIRKVVKIEWVKICFYFLLYVTVISLISPFLFENIKVYSAGDLSMDELFAIGGVRLHFSQSNIVQIFYLFINITTLIAIYLSKNEISNSWAMICFKITCILFIILGYELYIERVLNIDILTSIIHSNKGYSSGINDKLFDKFRLTSTFTESSYCGGVISSMLWFYVYMFKQKKQGIDFLIIILLLISLSLNYSSTGILAFILGLIYYIVIGGKKSIISALAIICFIFAIVDYLNYWTIVDELLFNKLSNQSGQTRSGADKHSFSILLDTYGIGVGIGSHRSSSLFMTLLSNIGVIGIVLYIILIKKIILVKKHLIKYSDYRIMMIYTIIIILAQMISLPDITFPATWMGIFCLIILSQKRVRILNPIILDSKYL